jgi:hypothetical protein
MAKWVVGEGRSLSRRGDCFLPKQCPELCMGQQHVKICEGLSMTKNGFQCKKDAKPRRGPDAMAKWQKEVMLAE